MRSRPALSTVVILSLWTPEFIAMVAPLALIEMVQSDDELIVAVSVAVIAPACERVAVTDDNA